MRFIKFERNGCMPCRKMDKILKQLNVEVEHINIDTSIDSELIGQYNICSVPTLVKIKDNGEYEVLHGILHTLDVFKEFCEV